MKRLLCLYAIILLSQTGHSQTSSRPTQQLDVDNLYKKYKDKDSVKLYFASEELYAKIKVEHNKNGKPSAVIMYGVCLGSSSIKEIIENLQAQKEKAGYRYVTSGSVLVPGEDEFAEVSIYQKGTQYAKYGTSLHGPFGMGNTIVTLQSLQTLQGYFL
jgi:hypothetical protein